ncbi:DNA repair protein RecN [Variovorax sp. J22R133]|uniref:DNA repair protein RecN n=1 Tax=Variovorax brevis TaxID=3053503 RepID=UPI002578E20F|nr:DNA repair protein RecN [Variovorax sp. J22R133]MDM0113899.1 DNA repair protein RecN [Variovorax sp. J22R133]
MALRRITLRDFVIVRSLDIDLASGFTVLTGETGAGKSILIDALQLALGSRADAGSVREGAQRLDVSAEFDPDPHLAAWLDEGGFEGADSLLLRRTVDLQGRSRGWINGSPATAAQMRELGDRLLDIHGQHAWQSLTRPEAVRGLLDAYAGVQPDALEASWTSWRQSIGALDAARNAQDSLQRERERLQWQIGEVMKLAPGADEWDELSADHTRMSNAQALIDAAEGARTALEDDESGALSALNRALSLLQGSEHIEPQFTALAEVLASSVAQAADAAHSLHGYLRHADPDPQRLAELDERMGLWMSLARRYKRTPQDLPALLAGWQTELAALDAAGDLEALERAEAAAQQSYMKEAKALAKARKQAAPRLAHAVTQAMQGLGMQGGQFEVALPPLAQPGRAGLEDVSFLVSGHAGSTPRAIGKVASGGELSRIALAIAVTTSELGAAQTLIFDEVDSGVGGAVAETVGRLMQQLGRDRQVLAVTHLPQVAACADHHLLVSKRQSQEAGDGPRTESSVAALANDARDQEIARMLGGERVSQTTLAHAREMLGKPAPAVRVRA